MSDAARRSRNRLHGLDLVVPGDWWRIPLRDAGHRASSIRRLVQHQIQGIDVSPTLRHSLEGSLKRLAADASDADGLMLWMSTEPVGGVPLGVSLVLSGTSHAGIDDLRQAIDAGGGDGVDVGRLRSGRVMRRVLVRDQPGAFSQLLGLRPEQLTAGDLSPERLREAARVLVVDYWVQRPWGGLAQLTFSSPLVPLREPLVELFDTVVDTIIWRDEPVDDPVGRSDDVVETS